MLLVMQSHLEVRNRTENRLADAHERHLEVRNGTKMPCTVASNMEPPERSGRNMAEKRVREEGWGLRAFIGAGGAI